MVLLPKEHLVSFRPWWADNVRGTTREWDKKRVILAMTGSPAGFSARLHKHLCQHEAGRACKGQNKWSGWGKMRMFLLLTVQDRVVYETVVKVPHCYPNIEVAPTVPDHLSAGPDSLFPQTRCHFLVTLLKTGICFATSTCFQHCVLKKLSVLK